MNTERSNKNINSLDDLNHQNSPTLNSNLSDAASALDQAKKIIKNSNKAADHTEAHEDPKSSKFARAKRVKTLRKMTRLSRGKFAEKHGILPGNFQNWEGPRYGGLSESGAKKIVQAVKTEGIYCTLEWLMHGVGAGPQITEKLYMDYLPVTIRENQPAYSLQEDEMSFITKELLVLRQHYPDLLDYLINDDAMEPEFKLGDYVAGKARFQQQIETLLEDVCIVKTTDGEILLRYLKKSNVEGRYNLLALNPKATVHKPMLYDVELISAAPVMWRRRSVSDPQPEN